MEEPYRITPQLALRIGILGTLALGVFALLFFRLWALQILSGNEHLAAAQSNQLRAVRLEAPRGAVLDREGRPLVSNRAATALQIWPADLPPNRRYRAVRRLASVANVPLARILKELEGRRRDPLTPVTVKDDVSEALIAYLRERRGFRGVQLAQSFLRDYEHGALAAHVLGYVGEISPPQLRKDKKNRYRIGDKIGQSGVEAAYDLYLRGRPGLARLRVDSLGRPRSRLTPTRDSQPGYALRLTLDLDLQRAAEQALAFGIRRARSSDCVGCWAANGGAIVALRPSDGAVLAMASYPTYNPSVYSRPGDEAGLARLLDPEAAKAVNYPGLNRATSGLYPPGSTFKPVTALAAMQERLLAPYQSLECPPQLTIAKQVFKNWNPYSGGWMTLPTALATSCDTYFYQLGYAFYNLPEGRGSPLQFWAARFGFGRPTGLDVGGEDEGLLPTPDWRRETFTKERYPDTWAIDRLWKPGDSVQLAIGQKDLLVTPLQMARFYALIANGGKLVTPYLALDVEQPGNGRSQPVVRRRFAPPPPKETGVDPAALEAVHRGLVAATQSISGTSFGVFGTFPVPVAGKTGTAEKVVDLGPGYKPLLDQSWWCGYAPAEEPELVVCAVIENGGFGASAAAPAALKVFERHFRVHAGRQIYVPSD